MTELHGHTQFGIVDEQNKSHHQKDGEKRRDNRDAGGVQPKDRDTIGDPGNGRIVFIQTAGDIKGEILHKIADTDSRDHNGHTRCAAKRTICHALDGKAEKHRQDNDGGNGHIQRKRCRNINHEKACHHKNITVGEVDQPQNAVYHGVADGNKRILPADRYPGDDIRQSGFKEVHKRNPLFG